jgi:hypothetical protein
MAKSPEQQAQTMIANLESKTGKSLAEWQKVLQSMKFDKHGEIVKHLKQEHEVTHGFANLIAAKMREAGSLTDSDGDLVDKQYAGAKAELRPIYEKLVAEISKFGEDVELAPKKAYVSLRRTKQFALIQPSTKTRVDVGINGKLLKATQRLEASGSFNAMVSHRVRLEVLEDVDQQLIGWLKAAYDES